jgi:hypothetical protein
MRQRISHYLASRSDPSLYQSVRNMSQFVSDDYGNRFLVELIQNAHDAHDPSRTDGEIAIVLDASEGEGCLYVANRGVGFAGDNLKAITNIALSSKPVNAGIGNKGLGFRSVLQVCNWPEIYSVQGEGGSGTFDGYCFRFATIDDLRSLLADESQDVAEEMARNLPCWHVPVPAQPGANVVRFAEAGFATVVRLPLKSTDALQAVRAQFDVLLGLKTPLHLFLERVGRISLDAGTGNPFVLERSVQESWTLQPPGFKVDSPITVVRLRLGSAEFVVAHWDVDDKLFRDALQSSLEKGEVPESWQAWEGAARVSVAVPLGAPLEAGRLYCFLPLGPEGKAPFAGYINANFYTKMDRRTVDASIRLNSLFMRMAAWLSCQLIGFLVKNDWPQAPSAVVSLLCWDEAYLETLKHAMGDDGKGILNREFLPVRGPDATVAWASPNDAHAWLAPHDACMSPKSVCEVGGGRILVDSLTLSQRAALDRLYLRLRYSDFKPPAAVVASWVERIAGKMHEDAATPERWAAFYDEVSVALAGHASTLFGKRFLLSVSGDLITSELPASGSTGRSRRAADVYFAPVLSVDADVDDDASKQSLPLERLPATLRKGFALLSRDVPWLKDDGGHRPGRSFLIAGKLAREYDTRDVLRTLAGVTRSSGADRTREQALEWAFRLWNSGRSLSDKETRSAGFLVPTAAGWIDAEAAMFGAGWDVPNGKKLQALLRITADGSEDLKRSLARLLPPHDAWPIRHGTQADWVRFLAAAGVTDCLRAVGGESVTAEPTGYPANLPAAISRGVTGLNDALRAHWRSQLTQDCARMYTSRQYRGELRPWRIPGQGEHESFPAEVRRDYAVQVALAMRAFADEHRSFRAVRADTGAAAIEPHRLSTPLLAFLTGAEWLPVTRPGGQVRFVKPSVAWYYDSDEERPPRFIDFVIHQVAAAIDTASLEWLQDRAHLGLFNDTRHAGRALVALCDAPSSRISDIRDVRRFQELFRRLWLSARQEGGFPKAGSCVPVLVNGEMSLVSKASDEFAVAYFDDERDGLKKQLLEEVGEPVFDFVRGDTTAAWNWVNASTPGRFRRISDEPAEVYVDGIKFDDSAPSRLLSDIVGPWIIDFLVCVAEHKSSAFVQSTQNTLGRIRRAAMALAVVSGQQIRIAHGEERVALPPSLRGALALHRPLGPVLIVEAAQGPFTLDHLAGAAGQLAAALGSRELAHGLDAALLRLAAAMRDQAGEIPDDQIVATALGVEPEAIRQTRRLASGDLIGMLDLAIPLSACMGSPEVTARLQELSTQDDPHDEDLRAALEALALCLGIPLTDLEERMMHLVDLPDLKADFSLPIAQLNAAIAALGGRYKPVSNEHVHRDAWTRHLRLRQPETVERLRERAAGTFDRREPLKVYVIARDSALVIEPDSAWFTVYDELPEDVMDAHIDRWIDGHLPAEVAAAPLGLTLNESRTSNGARLRDFWIKFSPMLSAWVRAPGTATTTEVRQAWTNPETARDACIARARDSGWLDFRALDDVQIANWLTLDGLWPAGHAVSVDLAAWGLSSDNMASSEERAKAERAEQQRRRTQVEFAGVTMSALSDGYADIAAAVAAIAAQAPALGHVSANDAPLEPMDLAKAGGGPGGGSTRGTPKLPESAMSDEQKLAIGLIGELWAREWLRRRHHLESVNESIWVSCYRDAVLNTSGGSDSWGYDFIVATKSRTYYYEVKASTGDPLRFEMGPTEIFAAQRYRADREHRYRILYLANVGDPARMTTTLLANPFSAKAAGKFRPVGKGSVVYEFDPIPGAA